MNDVFQLAEIKQLNEDLVRTHELDRRAIEELSATISVSFQGFPDSCFSLFRPSSLQDLEFRIRMGVVSDEYTTEICQLTHQLDDPDNKSLVSILPVHLTRIE